MRSPLYIDGQWRAPLCGGTIDVYNPFTEKVIHQVAAGGPEDVDLAVKAAAAAFPAWKRASGSVRGR
ncbi:MAG: aldehyde dehydrogenase family protein, partial [Parvibaculaceae bacterium]